MLRTAKLLAPLIPLALLASACSDECSSANDCRGGQVCYRGFCQDGRLENLNCAIDEDCIAEPSGGGPRAFICVATRCIANPGALQNVPDTGTPPVDTGILPDAMSMDATGMDAMSMDAPGMDAPAPDAPAPDAPAVDTGLADTGTITDAGTSTVADGG